MNSILLMMLMLFSGSPLNLPLSLPPLPPDPLISNVAPEQCLWYMSLAGVDKANPGSKNKVEQLLAEEDVQQFTRQLITKFNAAIAKSLADDPARKTLGEEGPKLVETLLTRPMCVYIGSIVPGGARSDGARRNGGEFGRQSSGDRSGTKKDFGSDRANWPRRGHCHCGRGAPTVGTPSLPPEMPPVQWGIKTNT